MILSYTTTFAADRIGGSATLTIGLLLFLGGGYRYTTSSFEGSATPTYVARLKSEEEVLAHSVLVPLAGSGDTGALSPTAQTPPHVAAFGRYMCVHN